MGLKDNRPVGEHEFYCCGARVLIKGGKIKVLTEPRIKQCPLHEMLYGTKELNKASVKSSVETKIQTFGFCCEDRAFSDSKIVPYGSSEIISVCMKKKILDCAVTVCEGAGTVVTDNPRLVQAIGARLTGIVRTSPIRTTIKYIRKNGGTPIDANTAKIDQTQGILKAAELGFHRIAVTVAIFDSHSIESIRKVEKEHRFEAAIFSVCNTCADKTDAERISAGADIVCASASKIIRDKIGPKALLQLGVGIPVFALTKLGKNLLLTYLMEFDEKIVAFRTRRLPYIVEARSPKLKDTKNSKHKCSALNQDREKREK